MAHYRDLEIKGENWRYNVGTTVIEIRAPDDRIKKMQPSHAEVLHLTDIQYEERRLAGQNTEITPQAIRDYIARQTA